MGSLPFLVLLSTQMPERNISAGADGHLAHEQGRKIFLRSI